MKNKSKFKKGNILIRNGEKVQVIKEHDMSSEMIYVRRISDGKIFPMNKPKNYVC